MRLDSLKWPVLLIAFVVIAGTGGALALVIP